MSTSVVPKVLEEALLEEVSEGKLVSDKFAAKSIWENGPVIIFAVRRPGWVMCREEAQDIARLKIENVISIIVLYV